MRLSADQQKRVASYDLAKADQIAIGPALVHLHDAHWPAPGDVNRAGKEAGRRLPRSWRADEVDFDALTPVGAERQRRVVGRIEQTA